jgi:hypothetical protein
VRGLDLNYQRVNLVKEDHQVKVVKVVLVVNVVVLIIRGVKLNLIGGEETGYQETKCGDLHYVEINRTMVNAMNHIKALTRFWLLLKKNLRTGKNSLL